MRVLVIGASGYIGNEVALALRAQGHSVFGLVRSQAHVKHLELNEITPVIGDITDSKSYLETVDKVNVVIDTAMVFGADPAQHNRALMQAVAESGKKSGVKKRYVYTSGCLVYGDCPNQLIDEDFPTDYPMGKWRSDFDRSVTTNADIEGVVIRPGFVYGKSFGKYTADFFAFNAQGDIEVSGNPQKMWSWIHVSDLADAYVRVSNAPAAIVSGQIFNVGDSTRLTFEQVREKFARLAGATGKVVHVPVNTSNWLDTYGNVSTVMSTKKLETLLNWRTKFGPLTDDLELYYKGFLAAKALKQ